jgi:hypothetical protein
MASVALCVAHDPDGARAHGVRYPVILMDELFDAEHPSIAENCGAGILNVVRAGGGGNIGDPQACPLPWHGEQDDHAERRKSLDG